MADPSFIITHRLRLDDAPQAFQTFRDKQHECIKVVMRPKLDTGLASYQRQSEAIVPFAADRLKGGSAHAFFFRD